MSKDLMRISQVQIGANKSMRSLGVFTHRLPQLFAKRTEYVLPNEQEEMEGKGDERRTLRST